MNEFGYILVLAQAPKRLRSESAHLPHEDAEGPREGRMGRGRSPLLQGYLSIGFDITYPFQLAVSRVQSGRVSLGIRWKKCTSTHPSSQTSDAEEKRAGDSSTSGAQL